MFQLLVKFGLGNQSSENVHNTNTCVQLLFKSSPINWIYLIYGDHVPAPNWSNHCFYWLKRATRNSRPTPGLPGLRPELVDPVRFGPLVPHAPHFHMTVVNTNSLKSVIWFVDSLIGWLINGFTTSSCSWLINQSMNWFIKHFID